MRLESLSVKDYLKATDVVDWTHPAVRAKAEELTQRLDDETARARRLFEWVRDEIPHSMDVDADVVTCRASEVLAAGTGICYAKAHLLAALLRAVNVPAGFCYQVLRCDPPQEGMVLHGLNAIYLAGLDQWVRVDARGNVGGCDAQFRTEGEQLAFPTVAAAGEFIYETIFVDPAPVVVETLRRFRSRREMWPHLPERLPAGA